MELITVADEPSYRIQSDKVTLCVAERGGQIAPVLFELDSGMVSPFSIAPWHGTPESKLLPNILRALRGDFFCMPFGANTTIYDNESHPLHGDTANNSWLFMSHNREADRTTLVLHTSGFDRQYRIRKEITLIDGHLAVYQNHSIHKMLGPMCYGHHAMLHFPEGHRPGRVSTSPFVFGQVFPEEFESPAKGGYSCLLPGATFERLDRVPMVDLGTADLTTYPAREGFEDLVMISSDPDRNFAWSAVTFPDQNFFWLSLKNRRDFPSTILWHSNGGRHYPPWSGRHRGVLGIEEVCAYFHYGLAESVAPNPISALGIPTFRTFRPDKSVELPTIMAAGELPPGAGEVQLVRPSANGAEVTFASGESVRLSLNLRFLRL